MEVYFLVYHVKPSLDKTKSIKVGGAYVSCWVNAINEVEAMKIAENEIALNYWIILTLDECYKAEIDNYLVGSNQREHYEQAIIDKWLLIFHTYPTE